MKTRVIRCYLLFILTCFLLVKISAQARFMPDARASGMANALLVLEGLGSAYNNPAGMARQENACIGISYENRFQIKEISTQSFAGILPVRNGGFGSRYSYFGTAAFNEQKIAFGYAHSLSEKIDAGIMLNYYSSNLPGEYKSDYFISGEVGLIVRPIEKLSFGAHLYNITNSDYHYYTNEEAEMFFRTGIAWKDNNFLIGTQLTLSKNIKPGFSVGTEVLLVKNIGIRAGISNEEFLNFTCGIGYKQKRWQGDIAFARHSVLGYTSFLSAEFIIGKLK